MLLIGLGILAVAGDAAVGRIPATATLVATTGQSAPTAAPPGLTLDTFRTSAAPCYERSTRPQTAVVDTHVHFRPFGGPAVPFEEILGYFEATGVLFANVYGIGQMLPPSSSCTYYLDCPGTPVTPTLKNDFVNAANVVTKTPRGLHLTLAMTFPDLTDPESILAGMALLDEEYPGALPLDGRGQPGQAGAVRQRARARTGSHDRGVERLHGGCCANATIPLAIHADLGSDEEPTQLPPVDGRGAAPVSGKRDRLGPHGAVAGVDRHGPGRATLHADDVDAGPPSAS